MYGLLDAIFEYYTLILFYFLGSYYDSLYLQSLYFFWSVLQTRVDGVDGMHLKRCCAFCGGYEPVESDGIKSPRPNTT